MIMNSKERANAISPSIILNADDTADNMPIDASTAQTIIKMYTYFISCSAMNLINLAVNLTKNHLLPPPDTFHKKGPHLSSKLNAGLFYIFSVPNRPARTGTSSPS